MYPAKASQLNEYQAAAAAAVVVVIVVMVLAVVLYYYCNCWFNHQVYFVFQTNGAYQLTNTQQAT